MNEFLQRLKQRKLVQWTVAYVAAAFACSRESTLSRNSSAGRKLVERILVIRFHRLFRGPGAGLVSRGARGATHDRD